MGIKNPDHKYDLKISMILSYLLSINSYIFARHLIQVFTNYWFFGRSLGDFWIYFFNGLCYFATFLCGCLMAALIEKRAWLTVVHGSLATAIALMLYGSMSTLPLKEYIYSLALGSAVGAILGGVGSIITLALKSVVKKYR
ncbi:hypothetical protein [Enterobacter sp. ECC-019]|uniref:hypothetical protein n=1 Tax=Enterobacter sp. ECC-019 TaxID=3116478 RepID=UPI0037547943